MTPDPLALFDAEIVRVKTMADGSPRFELGAGEDANRFLSILAEVQANNKLVKIIMYKLDDWKIIANGTDVNLTELDDATKKDTKSGTDGVDSRRASLRRDKSKGVQS